jgi:4-diphosphocytidyl-2-C-methyl-D-erythritol kinase
MSTTIGTEADNLVLRAAQALADRVEHLRGGAFHLIKLLPVASGIGGGSADAAAALRLLARANALPIDDPRLFEAAVVTGADVPVCLYSQARIMTGRGEGLGAPIDLPPLFAVLVNPGVPLETRHVFGQIGLKPGESMTAETHPVVIGGLTQRQLLAVLKTCHNDMEASAKNLQPIVGEAIALLAGAGDCRLARMSGSGATCFGLFDSCHAAAAAAQAIRGRHASWWVKPTILR